MISVETAIAHILASLHPLPAENVGLHEAVDRVLTEDFVTRWSLPHWDNSAMDGYALRAQDVTNETALLEVVDTVPAGDGGARPIGPGQAARIFTGAPLPPGTDTVMIQELATMSDCGTKVRFKRPARPGENVRKAGSDVQKGEVRLREGRRLTAGDINFMVSQGAINGLVHRRPEVAIVSTGSELCEPGHQPGPGQIINSNVIALAAAVGQMGCTAHMLPTIPDQPDDVLSGLKAATRFDLVVVCGGMSVGDYDFVRDALRTITGDGFQFWKVALKPGKPLGFGCAGRTAVFGLPGNPASALVTFEIFVRPAIRRMMGWTNIFPRPRRARLATPLPAGGDRRNYLRATITSTEKGLLWVDAKRNQSSGSLGGLASADALVMVEAGAPAKDTGEWTEVHMLSSVGRPGFST